MRRHLSFLFSLVIGLFVLTACPNGGGGPGGGTVNISGTVVDTNQQPIANTPVAIVGGASTTTDATGNFSFSNVSIPYDLAAVSASNEVVVYQGLTRNDPTVSSVGSPPSTGNANTANVQGKVSAGSGGQFPEPTLGETEVAFGSPEASETFSVDPATGSYPPSGTATVDWFGPSSTAGTLHALQWESDANGFPTDYKGYGDTSLTLQAGGSFSSPTTDITLDGVSNATFGGSLAPLPTASSGPYALASKGLAADFGHQATIGLLNDPSTSTSFSYTTPDVSGANARFFASAGAAPTGSSGTLNTITISTNAIDASGVTVELFAAPELGLPADNASGIGASSTFQWSPFDSGVYVVQFTSPNGPNYFVITDDAQTTLPELANIAGFNLPSSTSYDWEVLGYAPFASTDDTAEHGFFGSFLQTSDVRLGTSGSRSFTTQ